MKIVSLLLIVIFAFPLIALPQPIPEYDLVIINGRIVDGTGNPWFRASIGIKDGKIVKVGRIETNSAKQIIDARNQIVAPGFIDVHTHVEDIFGNPSAENF